MGFLFVLHAENVGGIQVLWFSTWHRHNILNIPAALGSLCINFNIFNALKNQMGYFFSWLNIPVQEGNASVITDKM